MLCFYGPEVKWLQPKLGFHLILMKTKSQVLSSQSIQCSLQVQIQNVRIDVLVARTSSEQTRRREVLVCLSLSWNRHTYNVHFQVKPPFLCATLPPEILKGSKLNFPP